jgi:LL-diaminopimelate aminotransferase
MTNACSAIAVFSCIRWIFTNEFELCAMIDSYPTLSVDTSVMMGQTGEQDSGTMQYEKIVYMPCTAENGFFPDYSQSPRADIVYLCSPK